MTDTPRTVGLDQVCALLGFRGSDAIRSLESGELRAYRGPCGLRFLAQDVEELLSRRQAEAASRLKEPTDH